MRTYSFSDLIAFSGATTNQVKNWVQKKVVPADIAETAGTGNHRGFSFQNLFEARVAERLSFFSKPTELIEFSLLAIRYADGADAIDAGRFRALAMERNGGSFDFMSALNEEIIATYGDPVGKQSWQQFRNKNTRDEDAGFWLFISRENGFPHLVDEQRFKDLSLASEDHLAINLRGVLEAVEESTGDCWS